jgi:hypothetical protein
MRVALTVAQSLSPADKAQQQVVVLRSHLVQVLPVAL